MQYIRRLFQSHNPQPDTPRPFGYKQSWMTLTATDPFAVAQALHLTHVQPCTWEEGISLTNRNHVFVSPCVRQWLFIVGRISLFHDDHQLPQILPPFLNRLSLQFGMAHYFSTHRVVDYHCWARSEQGQLMRGYAYFGERGETLWNEGEPRAETELGFAWFDEQSPEAATPAYWERPDLRFPDETSVMAIARSWCIAPIDLTPHDSLPALGLSGRVRS
jgi:hypothetical protein